MSFLKDRIDSIRRLSGERNFAPAVLLGGKAIIILSFFLSVQTVSFFHPIEKSLEQILAQNSFLVFSCYVALFVIIAGKQIIQIHMFAFSRLDSALRKAMDSYSIKYWKKNKKDSEFLSKFASAQTKIFKPFLKMGLKKRNALVLGTIVTYLVLDYARFGLLQMAASHLAGFFATPDGGIRIAS